MQYLTYQEFNERYNFEAKAGFKLKPLQVALSEELVSYRKSLNKAEVGCGKTTMATVVSLIQEFDVTVVTVPPILINGWVNWLNQVSENVVAYRGNPRERKKLYPLLKTARWIVCSHAIFRDDFDVLSTMTSKRNLEVIVDEAHWIKNPKAVLFKKVKLLTAGNQGLQMLTGTPTSKPTDSYSYIKLKSPKIYRNYGHFEAVHVAERDFFKNPTKYDNLEMLAKNLNLQSVSATKEEMHGYDLKPLMPDCSYDLDPAHYKLYQKLVDEQLLSFDDGSIIDASTVQKLRQALQQIVVNWDYFSNDPANRSAAYSMIDQTVEEIEVTDKSKSKLIIWITYKRSARAVTEYCNKLGIKTVAAYADAPTEKNVELFMSDESTRILVANPQSCGAGLNPQYVCSEDLYLEFSTSPIYVRQALGRIDRLGQTRIPRHKLAVARGTVQVGLLADLLRNDDLVQVIEPSKKSIRDMLLGGR